MEEVANQSQEVETPVSTQEAPTETGGASTPVTTQEEYDIIKYNKEEVKIPVSERQNYLQKGYNYDKVQQKATELEGQVKYLEKRARQEGFADVQSYLKAIDDLEQKQQIEQEAQRMGVDPDTYAQYFQPVNKEVQELRSVVQNYQATLEEQKRQEQAKQQWNELYNQYPHLTESSQSFNDGKNPDWFNEEMQKLLGMGYQPVHAYELANKNTLFQQKEQEVLARVTGRDGKQVLPSKDSPNNIQFDPANMSFEDIKKISERVQRGERITF